MTTARVSPRRRGMTLVELIVATTLLGIVGLSMMRTFISQARFADLQDKKVSARAVSRAPVNLFMSDARMVETGQGVVAASRSSVTLRVPVLMGLVCGTSGSATVLSLMPVDSVALASIAISGTAWRTVSGTYVYNEGTTTLTSGGSATCAAASITTVAGGSMVQVTPALAGASVGTVAFVYQRVRFEFAASTAIPGTTAFWRVLEGTNAADELAAPLDTASRFNFFRNNIDTPQSVVPPLSEIRGLELSLVGTSEKPRFGRTTPEIAKHQTAVFFVNRID